MSMTSASLRTILPNFATTSKQSLNAYAKQDSNLRRPNAILESNKLTSWVGQLPQKESHHKLKKSNNSSKNSNFRNPKKHSRYILNFYRNYIPRLSEKLTPFFKLPKQTSQFSIPDTILEVFKNLNQQLEQSCKLAPKQPIKNKQLILMTDASFTAAGYAIMIEDEPDQKAPI